MEMDRYIFLIISKAWLTKVNKKLKINILSLIIIIYYFCLIVFTRQFVMKLTRHTLKKIETLLEEVGYEIIYEKGNFKSGYCVVEHKKVIVINKFYDIESRINCLIDILDSVEFSPDILTKESKAFFKKLTKEDTELPIVE